MGSGLCWHHSMSPLGTEVMLCCLYPNGGLTGCWWEDFNDFMFVVSGFLGFPFAYLALPDILSTINILFCLNELIWIFLFVKHLIDTRRVYRQQAGKVTAVGSSHNQFCGKWAGCITSKPWSMVLLDLSKLNRVLYI